VAAAFLLAACAVKKDNVRPELLEGPGYTRVDNNLHQIDGPPPGDPAFRLFRSGAPPKETFARWCGVYGIEKSIVLSGDAERHELAYMGEGLCPGFEVIYNVRQDHNVPVSDSFLEWFDQQIEEARREGTTILLRCRTGSHRAGRLAAYYQMKYQGLTVEEAIAVMDHNGMMMWLFNIVLIPQVRAMDDHLHGRPCSQLPVFCVAEDSDRWAPGH